MHHRPFSYTYMMALEQRLHLKGIDVVVAITVRSIKFIC